MNGQLSNLIMTIITIALTSLLGLTYNNLASRIEEAKDEISVVEAAVQIAGTDISDVKTKQEIYEPSIQAVGEIKTGVAVMKTEMEHIKEQQQKTYQGIQAIQRMLQTAPANAGSIGID